MHFEFHQNVVEESHSDEMSKEEIHLGDFIKSLFIFMPYKQFKIYDKKSQEIDSCGGRVSFHEYVSFHLIMDYVDELREYIKVYQYVSKENFTKFVREQEKK